MTNVISNLSYTQSRALEQTLMVYYHTRHFMDEEGNNSINGVGPKNGKAELYHDALEELLDFGSNWIDNELRNMKEDMSLWW